MILIFPMKGMMKLKKCLWLIITVLIMNIFVPLASAKHLVLFYNGEEHDYNGSVFTLTVNDKSLTTPVEPLIFNDYALVPLRDVFEAVGAKVTYIDLSKQIIVNYNDTYVRLKIGSNKAYVDDKEYSIPGNITPMLIAIAGEEYAKTMVPVRFIFENIGFLVEFDEERGNISIYSPDYKKNTVLNDYDLEMTNDRTTVIRLYSDSEIESITKPSLTSSGVMYFDAKNSVYSISNSIKVNKGAVKNLRLGMHDGYTRIALDTEFIETYKVRLSSDGQTITITVTMDMEEYLNSKKEDTNTENSENNNDTNKEENITQRPQDPVFTGEKVIVIDAGHGGSDPGAQRTYDGVTYSEKDINLSIAKKVKELLEDNGINVIMTREGDTYPTLSERSDLANKLRAAMFVSIHTNAATVETASGYEVYYSSQNNFDYTGLTSKELAQSVINSLKKNIKTINRGVKTENHLVTRTSIMPAVLIEIGFISNKPELDLMISEDYQNSFAKGVVNGILSVYNKAGISDPEIKAELVRQREEEERKRKEEEERKLKEEEERKKQEEALKDSTDSPEDITDTESTDESDSSEEN